MHVILINESTKKSLIKTRRVLSKFLPQIGSSTWCGQISEEGLEDLRQRLKASGVSKNTAVCCHRVLTRSRTTVAWTVGSQLSFDIAGRFAFRQTAARAVPQAPRVKSAVERFLLAVNRLVALFHDTGKASLPFRLKLKNGKGAEALRHDLLSFLVLAESLWIEGVTDESWLKVLSETPEKGCACVTSTQLLPKNSRLLKRVIDAFDEGNSALVFKSELDQLSTTAPGLMSFLWLVLTHHRLPAGDNSAQQLDPGRHINKPTVDGHTVADLDQCLKLAPGEPPWKNKDWLSAVSEAAKQALAALKELPPLETFPPYFWAHQAAHSLRPALILSDHLGSKQKQKSLSKSNPLAKAVIYANTFDDATFADTLTTHQLKVARLTRKVSNLAYADYPVAALPQESLATSDKVGAAYLWQLDLAKACAQSKLLGPSFVSIVAETGAGKTIAAARALHALRGSKVRATFALGLRSLTWQLAKSMLDDAGFASKDLVVAVGSPETLELDTLARKNQDGLIEPGETFGSESSAGEDFSGEVEGEASSAEWIESLCTQDEAKELLGKKSLSILTSPLVACTADHLVACVSLLKGGDAKLYLRLASADLVLDEIDAYTAEDLQSIAKLAFAVGMSGKNVILMSATMSPDVQAGLYLAWKQGLVSHCALHQKPLAFGSVFSSNTQPAVLLNTPDDACAAESWVSYVNLVSEAYREKLKTEVLRKLDLRKLTSTSLEGVKEELVDIAKLLHSDHFVVDPATGKRVSVGFIEFKTAKSAWKMAEHLALRPAEQGIAVKFVSYHSKFPRNYLGVLDATLKQPANRKDPHAFLQTPCLRACLDAETAQDIVVIVCTTTLIETGRDFDMDWAVLEPRSVRGAVQAAGRVSRHRRFGVQANANVVILDRVLSSLEKPDGRLWGMPGIEDALVGLRVTCKIPPILVPKTAVPTSGFLIRGSGPPKASKAELVLLSAQALPIKQWLVALDAQLCLLPAENYEVNRIGYLEQATQRLNLKITTKWDLGSGMPPSVGFYLNSWAPFNAVHASLTKFRGTKESNLLFIPTEKGVFYWDSDAKKRVAVDAGMTVSSVTTCNALIPDLQSQAEALPELSPHVVGCSLRCKQSEGFTKQGVWDSALGFRE